MNRSCTVEPGLATVIMDLPSGSLSVSPDEAFQLTARVTSPAQTPFSYRWLVFDIQDNTLRWPLMTLGYDDLGQGYSLQNEDLSVSAAGQGLGVGRYFLVVEARYPADGCQSPGWYHGRSNPVSLHVGHTIDGIAPGHVTEGEPFRVYSYTVEEATTAVVFIDDDLDDAVDPLAYEVTVQSGGYMTITPDPTDLPAIAGVRYVSVAEDFDGTGRSTWYGRLRIEPAGDSSNPNVVANEEDTSCGGLGTECSHPILPGQTWQGVWHGPGDVDYFTFAAGAGTEVRITLDRKDTTHPPQHPGAPSPELLLIRPDNLVFATSEPLSGSDTNTELVITLPMDGWYAIATRTAKGSGQYLLDLERIADGGSGEFTFGYTSSLMHLTTSSSPVTDLRIPVFDGFGSPLAAAEVIWHEGDDCGLGDFCPTGYTETSRSSSGGWADLEVTPQVGGHALWRPTFAGSGAGKSLPIAKPGWAERLAEIRRGQPVLGRLEIDGNAVTVGELPDLITANKMTRKYRLLAELRAAGNAKDGPLCGSNENTCGQVPPTFRAVLL
ncbi:MAG: hypothetical protein GY838_12760, partial [bacterium]|nr:hypothetical protein [bacterium]